MTMTTWLDLGRRPTRDSDDDRESLGKTCGLGQGSWREEIAGLRKTERSQVVVEYYYYYYDYC